MIYRIKYGIFVASRCPTSILESLVMARSKSAVGETLEILRNLEDSYKGAPQELRVRMLRLLRENPMYTLTEVSRLINCSERSVQRWWETYNKLGIEAVLAIKKRGRKRGNRLSD